MGLTVDIATGRAACGDSITAFLRAVDGLSEYDLLGASRCHSWTRLDVAVHVLAGWQEMLGGMVSPVDSGPTVDAASYWPAFADAYATDDPVPALMSQRRRSAAYARPAAAVAQLRDVGDVALNGTASLPDHSCQWQGETFTAGDFLAVWAVENVVLHLDLLTAEPAPASALSLARATVEALLGDPLPTSLPDAEVALLGSGRTGVPEGLESFSGRLPVLG